MEAWLTASFTATGTAHGTAHGTATYDRYRQRTGLMSDDGARGVRGRGWLLFGRVSSRQRWATMIGACKVTSRLPAIHDRVSDGQLIGAMCKSCSQMDDLICLSFGMTWMKQTNISNPYGNSGNSVREDHSGATSLGPWDHVPVQGHRC